jgi:hypothetical protein
VDELEAANSEQAKVKTEEQSGAPLDQVPDYMERAVRGDRRLRVQLFRQMQRLAHLPGAPAEERRLGEILCAILMGERNPDFSSMPEEMVEELEGFLARIRQ